MFRYEMSRVPSTLGNVTAQVLLTGPRLTLPLQAFAKVLVIRSFNNSDPIRELLAMAVKGFPLREVVVEFIDVSNITELIDAMNEFTAR